MNEFIPISCCFGSSDAGLFTKVVNQGIDSHLEAFTKSKFKDTGSRLQLNFHRDEIPLLTRRLREVGTEQADTWADDIETAAKEENDNDQQQ